MNQDDDRAEWEANWSLRVRETALHCTELETTYRTLKVAATEARNELDNALFALRRVSSEKYGELPLFEQQQEDSPAEPPPSLVPADPGDDTWRDVPVGDLEAFGLPTNIIELLVKAEVKTIGAIADVSQDGSPLTTIPKIGDKKADAIESALAEFWERRNRPI